MRQASQPHWLMLTITGRAFFLTCTNGESRSGRPSSRIANCLDNLLDCVNHQLRFLGLNVVRALGCDFVFGVWCKRRQRILRRVPRFVQCSGKIGGQSLPRAEIERLALRQHKERHGTERFRAGSFFHLIQAGVNVERLDVLVFFETGCRFRKIQNLHMTSTVPV